MKNENFEGKIKEIQFLENFISLSLLGGNARAKHSHTHTENVKKSRINVGTRRVRRMRKFDLKKKFPFLKKIYVEINFVRDYWMWNNMDNEDDEKEIYMRMTLMGIWWKGEIENLTQGKSWMTQILCLKLFIHFVTPLS